MGGEHRNILMSTGTHAGLEGRLPIVADPGRGQVLPRIAGRSTVAGCTRHRLPRDSMNSPTHRC